MKKKGASKDEARRSYEERKKLEKIQIQLIKQNGKKKEQALAAKQAAEQLRVDMNIEYGLLNPSPGRIGQVSPLSKFGSNKDLIAATNSEYRLQTPRDPKETNQSLQPYGSEARFQSIQVVNELIGSSLEIQNDAGIGDHMISAEDLTKGGRAQGHQKRRQGDSQEKKSESNQLLSQNISMANIAAAPFQGTESNKYSQRNAVEPNLTANTNFPAFPGRTQEAFKSPDNVVIREKEGAVGLGTTTKTVFQVVSSKKNLESARQNTESIGDRDGVQTRNLNSVEPEENSQQPNGERDQDKSNLSNNQQFVIDQLNQYTLRPSAAGLKSPSDQEHSHEDVLAKKVAQMKEVTDNTEVQSIGTPRKDSGAEAKAPDGKVLQQLPQYRDRDPQMNK